MSTYKTTALVHLKSVSITSGGTGYGTFLTGLNEKGEALFRATVHRGDRVRIGDDLSGAVATASYSEPSGAVAALHVARRGQVRVLRAPKQVSKVISLRDIVLGSSTLEANPNGV